MFDPQIGRWHVIDPKPNNNISLYSAFENNPILNNDPLGDTSKPAWRIPMAINTGVGNTSKSFVFWSQQRFQLEPRRGSTVTGIRDVNYVDSKGRKKGISVIRIDDKHGKMKTPHVNINEKVTGVKYPHIPLSSNKFNILNKAGKVFGIPPANSILL